MNNKILVPIDYSEVSANAFKYAQEAFPECDIILYHVDNTISTADRPYALPSTHTFVDHEKRLTTWVKKQLNGSELPKNIMIKLDFGAVIDNIINFAKEYKIDQIVMGTRDTYDVFDRWLGTISLGVIKQVNVPVYLIPKYAIYKPFKKVLVGSDHHLSKGVELERLKQWNERYNAFLHFLHVKEDSNDKFKEEAQVIINSLYESEKAPFGFEVGFTKAKGVSDSLLGFAYNMGADLIITIDDKQSFISALLLESVSKELILKSKIPVLFLNSYN